MSQVPNRIAAIAGRRIDAQGTQEPRFPTESEPIVKAGVKRLLKQYGIHMVVASAACGADIVALEAAVELKKKIRVVLPFQREEFRKSSVIDRGEAWGPRFDKLIDLAQQDGNVVVVAPEAAANEAAYEAATKRIISEAAGLVQGEQSLGIAIPIWDEKPRTGSADATQDFIERAKARALQLATISTFPLQLVEDYLAGKARASQAAGPCNDLVRFNLELAAQVARSLATRFLEGKEVVDAETIDLTWRTCQAVEAFGLARRLLRRRLTDRAEDYLGEPNALHRRQQRAICTSKDPDLAAAMRHDWALKILDLGQNTDAESRRIAGGIWKRRWEWDGARSSLEKSLEHYRAGLPPDPNHDSGYAAINCAFITELLASLTGESNARKSYEADATALRRDVIGRVTNGDLWACASLAEAYLAEGDLAKAEQAMLRYISHEPASWELETTLRQLVRLAHLRHVDARPVLEAALGASRDPAQRGAPLASLLSGRVGLALSGGGFRASLYHLGVLARLAEADLLRHVEVLSCVSGGSIVGAHYYLCLREALKASNQIDYVTLVQGLIEKFRAGVQRNVRTKVIASFENSLAIINGDDVKYADCVSRELHQSFYRGLIDEDALLQDLFVQPFEARKNFHPGRHNWTRHDKVPVLIINAATLNTGHSWQFTVRSMGESPFSIHPEVDSNPRLRRPNYTKQRSVKLRDAVAASACVPGLFAPMQLDGLYPDYKVRLVDGGVFDNQGTAGLFEQDCQVLLVSDASGQFFAETKVEGGHVAPLLRSFFFFQERMRQIGFEALKKRKEAGQVRGVAYVHMTQGLAEQAVDWTDCTDLLNAEDQLPDDFRRSAVTEGGVDKRIQRLLARIRTDLDVFSEIECATLMASGYHAIEAQLRQLLGDAPSLAGNDRRQEWFFSSVARVIEGRDNNAEAFDTIVKHLEPADSGVGRTIKLDKGLRIASYVAGSLALVTYALLAWHFAQVPVFTVGTLSVLLGLYILRSVLRPRIGNWANLLQDPRNVLRVPLQNRVGAIVLSTFAKLVIKLVDPIYVAGGRLNLYPGLSNPVNEGASAPPSTHS